MKVHFVITANYLLLKLVSSSRARCQKMPGTGNIAGNFEIFAAGLKMAADNND